MILSVGSLLRLEVEAVEVAAPWSHVHRHSNLLPVASTLQNTDRSVKSVHTPEQPITFLTVWRFPPPPPLLTL